MVMPLILLILLGNWETYQYLRSVSVVERVAFSVGNLVSRRSQLKDDRTAGDSANIGTYFAAARQIAAPVPLIEEGGLILSAVHNDGSGVKVAWQRAEPAADGPASRIGTEGGPPTLPPTLTLGAGDTVIVAEVFYTFRPFRWTRAVWDDAPGGVTTYRRAVFWPRYGGLEQLVPNASGGAGGGHGS